MPTRPKRLRRKPPVLYLSQILAWADAHHQHTGKWPTVDSGPILDAPAETWRNLTRALMRGYRGLPAGSSLARLLAEHRGVRNHMALPALAVEQLLDWVDA